MKSNYPGAYKRSRLSAAERKELEAAAFAVIARRNPLFAAILAQHDYFGKEPKSMPSKEKICGTCRWHKPDKTSPKRADGRHYDFECANVGSAYFAEVTEYGGTCEDWEGRE